MVECEDQICEYLYLDELQNKNSNAWEERIKINNKDFEVKIDTGAQLNVMPQTCFKLLGVKMLNSNVVIKAFGGTQIKSKVE